MKKTITAISILTLMGCNSPKTDAPANDKGTSTTSSEEQKGETGKVDPAATAGDTGGKAEDKAKDESKAKEKAKAPAAETVKVDKPAG